jgi:DNA transposition AAA+ family ATPase
MLSFPASCTYTAEQRKLCELYHERTARLRQSEAEAARDISYTAGSLSSLFAGAYGASPAAICKAIRLRLEADDRERRAIRLPEYAAISVVAEIARYCCTRRDTHSMGYVAGTPGVGKSWALARFAEQHDNALILTVPPGSTPIYLLRMIAALVGVKSEKQSRMQLRDAIIPALAGLPGGLLIVDEADRLKVNIELADTLRDLWEESRCAQVWFGTRGLLDYLDSHPDSLAGQIRRRFGEVLALPHIDEKDIAAILAQYADWPADLLDMARKRCRGNTARLCAAIKAARYQRGGTPSVQDLEAAFRALD